MKPSLILSLFIFFVLAAPCQSKKEVKKYKIRSATEWETINGEGNPLTYKSTYEEFDKNGRSILRVEYSMDGSILHKESAVYDVYGNKTEETEYDAAKKKNVRRTMKYNALKDKTEETEYNDSGSILKKTSFTYDSSGNKISEIVTDPSGAVLKKMTYTYNSKNLKTGKQTFIKSVVPESIKKWDYVYY
jgi:hypothetical protein